MMKSAGVGDDFRKKKQWQLKGGFGTEENEIKQNYIDNIFLQSIMKCIIK